MPCPLTPLAFYPKPSSQNLEFARVGGFHRPRRRDFAALNKASKGDVVVLYFESLATRHMKASGSPKG